MLMLRKRRSSRGKRRLMKKFIQLMYTWGSRRHGWNIITHACGVGDIPESSSAAAASSIYSEYDMRWGWCVIALCSEYWRQPGYEWFTVMEGRRVHSNSLVNKNSWMKRNFITKLQLNHPQLLKGYSYNEQLVYFPQEPFFLHPQSSRGRAGCCSRPLLSYRVK